MPAGDGTGPTGQGPMTGRGAGFCAGFGVPGYANRPGIGGFMRAFRPLGFFGQGRVPMTAFGRGWGRGRGLGRGRGGGRGRRWLGW